MSIRTFFYDSYFEMSLAFACLLYVAWHWQNDASHVLGFGLAVISFALWTKARYDLGTSYAILPSASRLVTTGLYSKIRHPMYLFSFLTLLGIVIALEIPLLFIFPLLLAVIQIVRARKEEQALLARYGNIFRDYRTKTWF